MGEVTYSALVAILACGVQLLEKRNCNLFLDCIGNAVHIKRRIGSALNVEGGRNAPVKGSLDRFSNLLGARFDLFFWITLS